MKLKRAPLPPGATLVETPPYLLTHRAIRELARERGALTVSGTPGAGKTFTVDDYFSSNDCDVIKIHIPGTDRGYAFLRRLVRRLGGSDVGDVDELLEELVKVVGPRKLIIYVDEAHRLNIDSLRQICFIRDDEDLAVSFVLVGSDFRKAYRTVPELWSRVTHRTSFDPLTGQALLLALAAFHPFLRDADPSLLLRIDEQHCRGNWRVWTETLKKLQSRSRAFKTGLTEQVAAAVLGISIDVQRSPARPAGTPARQGQRRKKVA
jgi:DNA transposition AAA+ family ATPase